MSDLYTGVLPKPEKQISDSSEVFKSTYLPLQWPLHAASIENKSRIDNSVSRRTRPANCTSKQLNTVKLRKTADLLQLSTCKFSNIAKCQILATSMN